MSEFINAVPPEIGSEVAFKFLDEVFVKIEAGNTVTSALISISRSEAEKDLQRVLAARGAGSPLPLDGRLFVVKDNIDVGGVPGTLGSNHFYNRIPIHDAEVLLRFRKAGAVLVGTANMHELAFGATSENPHFGTVKNPWDENLNAGGSSGGSAVSVAQGWVDFSLGTDTGGSVRCPASICGVSGLRPTFGLVSTDGIYPLAKSFDAVGLFSRKASDLAPLLDIASGGAKFPEVTKAPQIIIGIPTNAYFTEKTSSGYSRAIEKMSQVLRNAGVATFVDIDIPDPERIDHVSRMIVRSEAWRNYGEQSEQNPNDFGEDVLIRLQLSKLISAVEAESLVKEGAVHAAKLDKLFESVDLVLLPTVPKNPRAIGSPNPLESTEQNLAFTYLWPLAGLPGLSVPCGFDDGLPVGAQLIGPRNSDKLLCDIGARYQELTDWHLRKPARNIKLEPSMLSESPPTERKKK